MNTKRRQLSRKSLKEAFIRGYKRALRERYVYSSSGKIEETEDMRGVIVDGKKIPVRFHYKCDDKEGSYAEAISTIDWFVHNTDVGFNVLRNVSDIMIGNGFVSVFSGMKWTRGYSVVTIYTDSKKWKLYNWDTKANDFVFEEEG